MADWESGAIFNLQLFNLVNNKFIYVCMYALCMYVGR